MSVIDTGVEYTHEDLRNNAWVNPNEIGGDGLDNDGNGYVDDVYGWDFFAGDSDPMDEEGHGTHVAGTICAEGNNSIGVAGVAWNCNIMALRFLGPDGGYTSDAISALEYAVAQGVNISNNSWGGGGYSQGLYDAIQAAGGHGHLFVAAAGNGGGDGIGDDTDSTPHYPSSYNLDNVISVAATDNRDQLAGFSNYGVNSVDLGAPGVDIASTMLASYYWNSGTSMAAPHVAGVAALILSNHSNWGYVEVKDRIMHSTRAIAALAGKTVTGGIINAHNALLESTTPPSAPSGLEATDSSHDQIDLTWTDNANNEDGYTVERSLDGNSWSQIASLGQDVVNYSDLPLDAETTFHYRVASYNSAGMSGYSDVASATTKSVPASQQVVSSAEIFGAGTVTGSYEDTWVDDGISESITERSSGGRPSSRYSYLQHTWVFEVPPGSTSMHVNAWSDISVDSDSFEFSYSMDNSEYTNMLAINGGSDHSWYSYAFPAGTFGTIYIRVTDTDHTAGNQNLDAVNVDQLYILTEQETGDPPAAPTDLDAVAAVPGEIALTWTDQSDNEYGFEVERSGDSGVIWSKTATTGADAASYTDTQVASETTYWYRVRSYNGAGNSNWSNEASATSLASATLELSASAYKVRGWQSVDLNWNDSSTSVNIYRDGNVIVTTSGGSYTDANIAKGGGSYTYQVCTEDDTSICSNTVNVNF